MSLLTPWTLYRIARLIGSQRRRWMFRCVRSQFTAVRGNVEKVEAEKAAARELWKSNNVKETRRGSESHDLGINGLSTARGISQRFQEACLSTKRETETDIQEVIGTWSFRTTVRGRVPRQDLSFFSHYWKDGMSCDSPVRLKNTFLRNAGKIVKSSQKIFIFLPSLTDYITHKKATE